MLKLKVIFINYLLIITNLILSQLGRLNGADPMGLKLLKGKSKIFSNDTFKVPCSVPVCEGELTKIYCHGPLIWATWHFGLQRECPGMKLKFPPKRVLANFENLYNGSIIYFEDFFRFCQDNFENHPFLEPTKLPEWKPKIDLFEKISDPKMLKFARELHGIWPKLARQFTTDVKNNQKAYPVFYVPNRFIVPASLFQIYFYWDSYWIIKGLLLSELYETAHGMIENFAKMIDHFGYIPNAGLIQLSRRSQPPRFTQMVYQYFEVTGDRAFLFEFLPYVEKELEWWRTYRTVKVVSINDDETEHTLYQYRAETNCPRPEEFLEDYYLAVQSGRKNLEFIWSSTASACESGNDFSSRWFTIEDEDEDMKYTRKGIRTNYIVPVNINVLMSRNYQQLAQLYENQLNDLHKAKFYRRLGKMLEYAIDDVFRDKSDPLGVWYDFGLTKRNLRKRFYPSNIEPLLLLSWSTDNEKRIRDCSAAVNYLNTTGALNFKGGIPGSMERRSVELWDFPNGWPPHNQLIVKALLRCNESADALVMARKIVDGFLTTSYNGFFNPRQGMPAQMWSKYDVRFDDGRSRIGSMAEEQIGFGWTNGVALEMIDLFYTDMNSNSTS